jgi:hypothetical protein
VTNPPAEKKESSNYEEKKDGTYEFSQINTPPAETTTEEKTEVNVNTSPSPPLRRESVRPGSARRRGAI